MMDSETTPPPAGEAGTPEGPAPPPEEPREPFWGYGDLALFIGMALPSLLIGALAVRATVAALGIPVRRQIYVLLPGQFVGYLILFTLLWLVFRYHYQRPFWRSLGWVPSGVPAPRLLLGGVALAFAVAFGSALLQTPDVESPMKELLADGGAVFMVAIFATTLGPLAEELAFRGFMQPLFVRSVGAVAGILLASLPFGLLHLQQYGWSWRHGLLITLAGAGFGWMRHRTGSTRAATIMHIAYNCTFFLALVAQRREFPQTW